MSQIKIRHKIQQLDSLPMLPTVAQQILSLSGDPNAMPHDLAAIVKIDPSLSAQIIRQANSAFYGYQGKIDSVEIAITQVLGFDWTMSLALVISTLDTLSLPSSGPLSLLRFWHRAVACALLSEKLAKGSHPDLNINLAMSYLAGLIHDIGFIAMCHLCPKEYGELSRAINENQDKSPFEVEQALVDVNHLELGGLMMEHWQMPGAIISAVREHSNTAYDGPDFGYANLVMLATILLNNKSVDQFKNIDIPEELMKRLGLDLMTIHEAFTYMQGKDVELSKLAGHLSQQASTLH